MAEVTQCPVCKMDVDPQNSPKETFQGQEYHFCSDGCREQFLQDPSKYASA